MDDFERLRSRLFGIAYRMTGTATDAEEIMQDAWLRWQTADRQSVRNPDAYLAKLVTNLSIRLLTSARARRETYVGEWLPEPILTGRAEFDALGPLEVVAERASRAGKRIAAKPSREQPVDRAGWRKLVERFLAAARLGQIEELEWLLAEDVVSTADGGGKVIAARKPVRGRERVARYLIGTLEHFGAGIEAYLAEANGGPALVAIGPEGVVAIGLVEAGSDGVTDLRFVMNPDKLAFAANQLSRIGGLPGQSW
jgi:RNA polymerase sigma-70 factor (ECF subfamily)